LQTPSRNRLSVEREGLTPGLLKAGRVLTVARLPERWGGLIPVEPGPASPLRRLPYPVGGSSTANPAATGCNANGRALGIDAPVKVLDAAEDEAQKAANRLQL
jgi:hypothetical protein